MVLHPMAIKNKKSRTSRGFSVLVTVERQAALGKIRSSSFLSETPAFQWEESPLQIQNKSCRPFRLRELPMKGIQSSEGKDLLSGISLIAEINLD